MDNKNNQSNNEISQLKSIISEKDKLIQNLKSELDSIK